MWNRKSERLFIEIHGFCHQITLALPFRQREQKPCLDNWCFSSESYAPSRECSQLPSLSWPTFQQSGHCLPGGSQAVELRREALVKFWAGCSLQDSGEHWGLDPRTLSGLQDQTCPLYTKNFKAWLICCSSFQTKKKNAHDVCETYLGNSNPDTNKDT